MYIQKVFGVQVGIALGLLLTGECLAQDNQPTIESAIRKAIPQPARCSVTPEPLFYCRFDNAFEGSVILELSATKQGPAASLTHEHSDPKGAELLTVVRNFFGSLGVDSKSFVNCVRQSYTVSSETAVGDLMLACRYAELGTRVTYEVFAYQKTEASPGPFLFADAPALDYGR